VTEPAAPVTQPGPPLPPRVTGREIGRAAALIGLITVAARVIGFARQLVFAHTVGTTCLGTAYATANQVPNIIYDVVIGGALTSAVVPVLAGTAARRGICRTATARPADPAADAHASQTASALLTWAVLVLLPASGVIAAAARPLASLLLAGAPHCPRGATTAVGSVMLAVFAPQITLYGLAVVLYGILQAHRRFTAPALAPVLSSLVVIAAYAAFVPLSHRAGIGSLPLPAELTLAGGTTAGVAALVLTPLGPVLRLRLRLRPTLRFPPGVARRAGGLAAVGLATLVAQDASLVVVIVLANGHQGAGALVLYNYGWQMFFVPYAVLAVPIATSAFPVLSADWEGRFDRTAAAATRAVMLASWLGAGLLAGAAVPAARLFVSAPGQARELAFTFAAFAPGLAGYGLAASLSRVLFAARRTRLAAVALVGGWLAVIAVAVVLVPLSRPAWVVPALALANTAGMSCAAAMLLAAVRTALGRAALRGAARAGASGLAAAAAGGAAGWAVSRALTGPGFLLSAGVTALACMVAAIVFGLVVLALDGPDLRALALRAAWRGAR
jgi:putative peptidoglycan lipid II flippase